MEIMEIKEIIKEIDRRAEILYETGENSKDPLMKRSCDASVTTLVLLKMWINSKKNEIKAEAEKLIE